MTLAYVTVTGSFGDGSGNPVDGEAVFTPSAVLYAPGVPAVIEAVPVTALVSGGQLEAPDGGPLRLLATDNEGLTAEGQHAPGWTWAVTLTLSAGGTVTADSWSFELPSSPGTTDLYSTR